MRLGPASVMTIVVLSAAAALTARADDNSWTGGSDKWETDANWSLAVAPSTNDASDSIANDGNNTVTIDAATSGSFSSTMTINNLTLSAPTAEANTLFLSNAGTTTCLHTLGSVNIGSGGLLVITNSAVLVDGSLTIDGGEAILQDGLLVATNSVTDIGPNNPGAMTVSNGTVLAGNLIVEGNGTLTAAGGNILLSSDLAANGSLWVSGGLLQATNGTTDIEFNGEMAVSNGTVAVRNVSIGTGSSLPGYLTVAGGVETISSNLVIGFCADNGGSGVVTVDGGSLVVTNAAHDATIILNSGLLQLNSGVLLADVLVMTNGCSLFVHSGGSLIVGSLVLDPNLDADADGMPNGWEQAHDLDPLDAADAGADPDGDGFTNLQEYQFGTDPQDAGSTPFHITGIAREGNGIRITWSTVGGTTNFVQAGPGASRGSYSNNFSDLSPLILVADSGLTSTNYLDIGGATNAPSRFYRVRLAP